MLILLGFCGPLFKMRLAAIRASVALSCALLAAISCQHIQSGAPQRRAAPSAKGAQASAAEALEQREIGCKGVELGPNYLRQGADFFQQGRLSQARDCFESINYRDEGFVSALREIQKINYREARWSRFFGLAVYYRGKMLSTPEAAAQNFRQEMPALEILALLRHCRPQEARRIKEWGLRMAAAAQKDSSQIQKAGDFLNVGKRVGDSPKPWMDWGRRIHLWPVAQHQIISLDNPKQARAKVKSKC